MLANDFITHTKKRHVITNDKDDKPHKPKSNLEKRESAKQVGKKSTKAFTLISSLVNQPSPNIQAFFMNINIVILALHFFQILPTF